VTSDGESQQADGPRDDGPVSAAPLSPELIASVASRLRSNEHVADVSTVPFLSAAECEDVVAEIDESAWRPMKVWQAPVADPGALSVSVGVADDEVRRGVQQPVPGGNRGPLATRVTDEVFRVNHDVYRFDLVGVEHPIQVFRYGAESSDGYVAHIDIGPTSSLRKLSFSLLLSDPDSFDGGDLSFGSPFAGARAQGTLTLFPSYLGHAVTPVTRGIRHAVVGFAIGPAFR